MIATRPLGSFIVNLGNLARIPHGESRVFQVGGRSIVVFRTPDSTILATDGGHKEYPVTVDDKGDILLGVEQLWPRR